MLSNAKFKSLDLQEINKRENNIKQINLFIIQKIKQLNWLNILLAS
jgi:hypothetical protein